MKKNYLAMAALACGLLSFSACSSDDDFGGDERYEYPGRIIWIAEESEFTPKSIQTRDSRANLVYAVKIAVKNDGRLKLGQYGEVRL